MKTILDLGGDICRYGVESRLYIAKQAGRVSGGNIVLYTQKKALYLFGSSIRNNRVISPSYALQWYTIRAAKDRGCLYYDLYGIAPEHEERHHLHSLNLFKKGFGGAVSYRAGCFDYVYNHALYAFYTLAERIRITRARS
jgi:lipid II:glycine glycyltransferase (peptidoglycan interpeptide bridge formation enzyme)